MRFQLMPLALGMLAAALAPAAENWPQAAGPHGNWRVASDAPPATWSVALDKNIRWRTALPNGGQSGIAVWGDRLFLTTFPPIAADAEKFSADILGHCLDAKTGEILWTVELKGSVPSPLMYAYSDSTTPTPVTDGERVWFFNASGLVAAFNFNGKKLWERKFTPWGEPFPFNKQHEPIAYGDVLINLEPLADGGPEKEGWNYLHAIDERTGATRWIAKDGTTSYTTSMFGRMADGTPAILTGRGGWHDVPERPVGLSLVSLARGHEGQTIWRYVPTTGADGKPLDEPGSLQAPTFQALYNLHWNAREAYWFRMNPVESHLVIDAKTGELLREQSLIDNVDYRPWDAKQGKHKEMLGVNLREIEDWSPRVEREADDVIRVQPAWFGNIVAEGYHYFLTSTGHRRNRFPPKGVAGPSHCLARVNVESGKVEYLELPVTVIRSPGKADEFRYGEQVRTSTENSTGIDVAAEDRSRRDGWQIPAFWGSPVEIGKYIYFTTMLGITYVIDASAPVLDERAIVAINDLGPSGETWSLNTPSYAGGVLYHRTLKEVIAIAGREATE